MIKIFSNYNHQDISYSYTMGQVFPKIEGKLIRVEVSGNELDKLVEAKEIPVYESLMGKPVKTFCMVWNGKQAGSILKTLKELFDQ